MSGADDLRAARESRADAASRADRPGLGDTMTRLVEAAIYRAAHQNQNVPVRAPGHAPAPERRPGPPPGQAPLGRHFSAAMRIARARLDDLPLSRVRTSAGAVDYLDTGTGKPVLLVHGIFGGSDAAMRQLRAFVPDGFRAIAPSRFGYLGSDLPSGATPARQADAYAELLDHLGVERTAVVAASAGAPSALLFAIRHPARVSALALITPAGPGPQHDRAPMPHALARVLWGSERLMWLTRHWFARRLGVPATPADQARLNAELDGIFPVTSRVDGALFDAYVGNPDVNHGYNLAAVHAPTLVVHARDDALAPAWGAVALAQSVPGARLLVVEHGGHLLFGDHPEVAATVHDLLLSSSD